MRPVAPRSHRPAASGHRPRRSVRCGASGWQGLAVVAQQPDGRGGDSARQGQAQGRAIARRHRPVTRSSTPMPPRTAAATAARSPAPSPAQRRSSRINRSTFASPLAVRGGIGSPRSSPAPSDTRTAGFSPASLAQRRQNFTSGPGAPPSSVTRRLGSVAVQTGMSVSDTASPRGPRLRRRNSATPGTRARPSSVNRPSPSSGAAATFAPAGSSSSTLPPPSTWPDTRNTPPARSDPAGRARSVPAAGPRG